MDNNKFELYLCEYNYGTITGNGKWTFKIFATSFQDANNRMRAITTSGNVYGKEFLEFDASKEITQTDFDKAFLEKFYEL